MDFTNTLQILFMAVLSTLFTTTASPQFYPLPFTHKPRPPTNVPQGQVTNAAPFWHKSHQQNLSHPGPSFLDPLTSRGAEEVLKNDIPRQAYPGYLPPPFPATSYPQIYKLDNLIIIANPPAVQAQPCPPQRPPPDFPPIGGDEIPNRIGGEDGSDEPSKCTWAIVACCSPGNNNVRYNCFELLGCPGLFFDNSPCQPNIVMAAANAALNFYRNANNTSRTDTTANNNQI